ncbi:hypothetical protein GCM10023238_12250 [Streptomyces heliomycini]
MRNVDAYCAGQSEGTGAGPAARHHGAPPATTGAPPATTGAPERRATMRPPVRKRSSGNAGDNATRGAGNGRRQRGEAGEPGADRP